MKPWPHQQAGLDHFWAAVAAGHRKICLTSPTGGGKSLLSSMIIKEGLSRGWKSVFHVNRKSLAEQTRKTFEKYELPIGMRASGYPPDFKQPVQISMTPTEANRSFGSNPSWSLHDASLVIFDEVHSEKSARAKELIKRYEARRPDTVFCGLTATPLDVWDTYDTLVVAGVNSELRACGAHLFCKEYCPTMPDMLKAQRNSDGEYSESVVEKHMQPSIVFGHIIKHHRRLNPLLKPAILFAPSVKASITITDMYLAEGIRAAHIDGKSIYYGEKDSNGNPVMEDSSKISKREELFDRLKNGDIQVLSNRFVLVAGLDFPQVYQIIFATAFGSLTQFLQAGGRVLRNHCTIDHVLCIARGSEVLTDRGLVQIQNVKLSDKVWDGVEFVTHGGAVLKGYKKTITWDGLTATPDHKVHTENGWKTLEESKSSNERITKSGSGGNPIRVLDNSNPYDPEEEEWPTKGRSELQQVWRSVFCRLSQNSQTCCSWMLSLYEQIWRALPRMALQKGSAPMEKVQHSVAQELSQLWRSRNRIQIRISLRRCLLDSCQPWVARRQEADNRQSEQRRPLRTRKPSLGNKRGAVQQSKEKIGDCEIQSVHGESPRDRVLKGICNDTTFERIDVSGDCRSLENERKWHPESHEGTKGYQANRVSGEVSSRQVQPNAFEPPAEKGDARGSAGEVGSVCNSNEIEVWDIVNAGPRNRFTASGCLVGNCADHGGNYWRHGSLNDDRVWEIGNSSKKLLDKIIKDRQEGKNEEPIVCPRCGAMRLSGGECWDCGLKHTQSGAKILETDGTLRQLHGPYVKTRKAKSNAGAIKAWNNLYFPVSMSKSNRGMTWKQMLSTYKMKNPDVLVFETTDVRGRKRIAAAERNGEISMLPNHPPIGDIFLWSQKVKDVPRKELIR